MIAEKFKANESAELSHIKNKEQKAVSPHKKTNILSFRLNLNSAETAMAPISIGVKLFLGLAEIT